MSDTAEKTSVPVRCVNPKCRKLVCYLEHTPPGEFEYRSPDGAVLIRTRATIHCGGCGNAVYLRPGKKALAYWQRREYHIG